MVSGYSLVKNLLDSQPLGYYNKSGSDPVRVSVTDESGDHAAVTPCEAGQNIKSNIQRGEPYDK